MCRLKFIIFSWFWWGISHTGYVNDPAYLAAVGNFGQYAKAWPSELVGMKKTMAVVKSDRSTKNDIKTKKKSWLIHVPAAAVIHEWLALSILIGRIGYVGSIFTLKDYNTFIGLLN